MDKPIDTNLSVRVFGLDEDGIEVRCDPEYGFTNPSLAVVVKVAEGARRGEALYYLSQAIKKLKEEWPEDGHWEW